MNRKKNTDNSEAQEQFVFAGFEAANTTPVPDVLFDKLLAHLTGAELKVLLYIIRRTWGFKKDTDAISLSQFTDGIKTKDGRVLDEGCGVSDRQTVLNAQASLERKGCIESDKEKTAQGDNATTIYKVRFQRVVGKSNHPQEGSRKIQPPGVVGKSNHRSMENPTTVVGKSNPQETVLQDTVKQQTEDKNIYCVSSDDAKSKQLDLTQEEIELILQRRKLSTVPVNNTVPDGGKDKEMFLPGFDQDEEASKHPIAKETTEKTPVPRRSRAKKSMEVPTGIPVMPPLDAKWNAETAVQIIEALNGEYYSPTTRTQEKIEAAKILEMRINSEKVTREMFEQAWNKMLTWTCWTEHNTRPMLKHLRKDDRVVTLLKGKKVTPQQSGDSTPPSTPQACMTHDEACKLAQDAIEEAKQYNITIAAQAFSSKNNPEIWGVRVKWDDGSESGFPFPVIKVRGQWDMTLTEIRKIIKEEAKQAARSVARMQEAK